MKNSALLIIALFIILSQVSAYAQGELSVLMGIHPQGKIYNMSSGMHAAAQYNFDNTRAMAYGLIAQHSRFTMENNPSFQPQVSSLNGFASYDFVENRKMKAYLKMELGAAYASQAPRLESRVASAEAIPGKILLAEANPTIGAEISLAKTVTMRFEYKNVLHFGNPVADKTAFNYSSLDLGINYRFNYKYHTRAYAKGNPRCRYNKKTGAVSCYSFR